MVLLGRREFGCLNECHLLKKRNQSKSTSASIVGLALTEAKLKFTFKYAIYGTCATIGNVHILYSKKWE